MRALRYTNAVLTVLAVLLSLQLWTTWHQPGLAAIEPSRADAGPSSPAEPSSRTTEAVGLVDARAQRRDMIDLLKRQVQQADDLAKLLRSGQARMRLENPPKEGAAAVRDVAPPAAAIN